MALSDLHRFVFVRFLSVRFTHRWGHISSWGTPPGSGRALGRSPPGSTRRTHRRSSCERPPWWAPSTCLCPSGNTLDCPKTNILKLGICLKSFLLNQRKIESKITQQLWWWLNCNYRFIFLIIFTVLFSKRSWSSFGLCDSLQTEAWMCEILIGWHDFS